ncbi:hypothetical protein ABBQ38_013337 [Trebouxia sp. C0009 RCD-2024]
MVDGAGFHARADAHMIGADADMASAMTPPHLPGCALGRMPCQLSLESCGSSADSSQTQLPPSLPMSAFLGPNRYLFGHSTYYEAELIGKGSFGEVIRAIQVNTEPPLDVAIKLLERGSQVRGYRTAIQREIRNQSCLEHPMIISLKEVFLTPTHLALAMEYAPNGDLYHYVSTHRPQKWLLEDHARYYFQQLIIGLDYCHRKGVAVRDVKLENMLLTRPRGDRRSLLKICDFGYSKHDANSAAKTHVGTPMYMAPEILQAIRPYDAKKADLWSCGVALFALLFGQYPFDHQDKFQNRKIIAEDYTIPAGIPISPECKHVLQGLLCASPARRMCMEELLSHPWFLKDLPGGALAMNDHYLSFSVSLEQYMQKVNEIVEQASRPGFDGEDLSQAHAAVPKFKPN